jgi:hypothetical protein
MRLLRLELSRQLGPFQVTCGRQMVIIRNDEVAGSTPVSSTKIPPKMRSAKAIRAHRFFRRNSKLT